jgi:hypothetical protein
MNLLRGFKRIEDSICRDIIQNKTVRYNLDIHTTDETKRLYRKVIILWKKNGRLQDCQFKSTQRIIMRSGKEWEDKTSHRPIL